MNNIKTGRKITVEEMAPHVHSFLPEENKVNKISEWLTVWIKESLKNGKIKPYDFLPAKSELAFHIGVSLGTMQNVFRIIEDKGLVFSRQKIGTFIRDINDTPSEKLTSKRDVTVEILKQYIKTRYKTGEKLPSIRKLSDELKIPATTIRIAINSLLTQKILKKSEKYFIINSLKYKNQTSETKTIVDKVAEHIVNYIKNDFSKGDKIPSVSTLADMYGVSIKTVHDAIKILEAADIVRTRRGYYGSYVKDDNNTLYFYEQVEQKIKQYIIENCKRGDKLPSIKNFSEIFNVSTKTIKNALDMIANDGYIEFLRGRNGGTYITDIPPSSTGGYEWLALSREYEANN